MAGERYAKLTLRAGWSYNDSVRGNQTQQVSFRLAGAWVTIQRGGSAGQFAVPDPDDGAGRDFVKQGLQNLRAALQQVIAQRGLSYVVSAVRDAGDDPTHEGGILDGTTDPWPLAEFDVVATAYETAYNLDFAAPSIYGGWTVVRNLTTLRPLRLTAGSTPATIYNSATGSLAVTAYEGNTRPLSYQWADQATVGTDSRTGLVGPATYRCTVRDADGVSASIDVAVGSDPRLEVVAAATDTSIRLTITGGLPPYAIAWADGPTTAVRVDLVPGTYRARVIDARGAVQDVVVELVTQPYYWSGNAIALALDAGPAYRADPTTKPGLTFLCEVFVEPDYLSDMFVPVGTTLEQPADAQGRTTFQVQALLDPFLDYHVPEPGLAAPVRATPLFRRFYLRHAQQYGTPPLPEPVTTLEHHLVLRGGLSFYQAAARTWFSSYQTQQKPFLTWEPADKDVLADQPEFLYFQVPAGGPTCRVQVTVQLLTQAPDQDAPLPSRQVLTFPLVGARAYEVFCLPVSYQALGLGNLTVLAGSDAPAGSSDVGAGHPRVLGWQVQVVDAQGAALSEVRRYTLDNRRFPHRRYLLFATSLGGMATYAALGQAQTDAEVTGEEAVLTRPVAYDPLAGDVTVATRALRPVLKLASGPRRPGQQAAVPDLLLSRRVLLLAPAGTRWLPGVLKAKTTPWLDESKGTPTLELELQLPTESYYTPDEL